MCLNELHVSVRALMVKNATRLATRWRCGVCDTTTAPTRGRRLPQSSERQSIVCSNDMSSKLPAKVTYDSDEEPPQEEETKRLDWRLDPKQSHSDYTIEIRITRDSEGTEETTKSVDAIYHVHKCILTLGDRRSEYFACLLQNDNFVESQTNTSRIELHELAAKAFPAMLDYLYKPNEPLRIDTESATALHYLGQYFEIRRMRWEAKQYWKRFLTVENCATYYTHAAIFGDEKIRKRVEDHCVEFLEKIQPDSSIVKESDTQFWLTVLNRVNMTRLRSKYASLLVAEVCHHNKSIEPSLFRQLTDLKHLPVIGLAGALRFLELDAIIDDVLGAESSVFRERCMQAIARDWTKLDRSESNAVAILQKQNPVLLTELLFKSLDFAKQDEHFRTKQVFVEGAGLGAVNGVYDIVDTLDGVERYAMIAPWKGQNQEFSLFRCNVHSNRKRWYISVIPQGMQPGRDTDIDFYSAPLSETDTEKPPHDSWAKEKEGQLPVPQVSW